MSLAITPVVAWWREMCPPRDSGDRGDRAGIARLRRCSAIIQAMQTSETIALFRRAGGRSESDLRDAALVAAVLAHVRDDDPSLPVARRIGPESTDKPETARMKPLRFQRLLDAATADERLTAFRRLVALAGHKLNVRDLAMSLSHWDDEQRRTRWVYDYWNAGQPIAQNTEETSP